MNYQYSAVNTAHGRFHGTVNAVNKEEAIENLMKQGLTVLELNDSETDEENVSVWDKDLTEQDIHKVKIPKKMLLGMLNQMALMMRAGVSITTATDVMISSQKDKTMRKILQEIRQNLLNGSTISASMSKFKAFPEIIVSMIRSGEENGHLDVAFDRCASLQEKGMTLKAKLRGALIYPCILLCLTIALVIIMNIFVFPSFANIFRSFGAQLPALTKGVMAFSNFLIHQWYIIVGIIVAIIAGYKIARHVSKSFVVHSDAGKLKFPLFGNINRFSLLARFCRIMSSLIDAGVNVVRSLQISRNTVPNSAIQAQLNQVIEDVKVGVPINASMARFSTFDSLFVSMIKAGEESGMLGNSFKKLADLYGKRADESIKQMMSLMEPIMIIIVGVIVGIVIISIVMPMFGIYNIIK